MGACGSCFAANAGAQTSTQGANFKLTSSITTRRYLKGGTAATSDKNVVTNAQGEERLSIPALHKIPGLTKIKAAFQQNPSFAKNLETFGQKRQSLREFFKENPAIKKEIIIASVLLTLIVSVPLLVKSFYPA
ncbi:hypothetical protein PHYPSEUDO_008211 [Phytophthora pseudosyringae]|uniref:Uncharacterized protein n=1 Tax=Phytophthora pseudosyringae TaxID=221518 RepID=A0A8T1VHZ0_9STRA|nr:hypothetical protein PHYPSEUDO_008211 [Phytophthora pseudosyringae]